MADTFIKVFPSPLSSWQRGLCLFWFRALLVYYLLHLLLYCFYHSYHIACRCHYAWVHHFITWFCVHYLSHSPTLVLCIIHTPHITFMLTLFIWVSQKANTIELILCLLMFDDFSRSVLFFYSFCCTPVHSRARCRCAEIEFVPCRVSWRRGTSAWNLLCRGARPTPSRLALSNPAPTQNHQTRPTNPDPTINTYIDITRVSATILRVFIVLRVTDILHCCYVNRRGLKLTGWGSPNWSPSSDAWIPIASYPLQNTPFLGFRTRTLPRAARNLKNADLLHLPTRNPK